MFPDSWWGGVKGVLSIAVINSFKKKKIQMYKVTINLKNYNRKENVNTYFSMPILVRQLCHTCT